MPSPAAASAIRRCSTSPGEYFANSGSYAGNQQASTVAERRPKCAATGRSPAYRTDSVPVHCGARVSASRPTSRAIHSRANRSRRPVLRYCADFHATSARSAAGSRSSKTNRTPPARRSSRRSLASVVFRNFGDWVRSTDS